MNFLLNAYLSCVLHFFYTDFNCLTIFFSLRHTKKIIIIILMFNLELLHIVTKTSISNRSFVMKLYGWQLNKNLNEFNEKHGFKTSSDRLCVMKCVIENAPKSDFTDSSNCYCLKWLYANFVSFTVNHVFTYINLNVSIKIRHKYFVVQQDFIFLMYWNCQFVCPELVRMSVNFKTFMRHTTVYWCKTSQQCGWFKDLLSMFTNSDLDWYVSSGQNGERFQDQYFRITSKPFKVLNLTAHYCFDSLLWYVCRTLSLFCLAVNFSDLCYINSQTTMLHKLVDSSNTFH